MTPAHKGACWGAHDTFPESYACEVRLGLIDLDDVPEVFRDAVRTLCAI